MSEYDTALSVIRHEIEAGEDLIDALDLAAKVILDDRAVTSGRVNLRKPVILTKRARAGENCLFWDLIIPQVDYVKVTGRHAAEYRPENDVESPVGYASRSPKHAYQINMF